MNYLKNSNHVFSIRPDFTIMEGFTPKQAKKIIKELYDLKRLNIFSEKGDAISNSMKWKIADNISDVTIFKWISNEKK